jgi:hypothetical protein
LVALRAQAAMLPPFADPVTVLTGRIHGDPSLDR